MSGRRYIQWLIVMGVLCTSLAGTCLPSVHAAPVANSASGSLNGTALDLTNATVSLNQVAAGNAVSSALAEIAPNSLAVGSSGNGFSYDILPTINAGDTGVDRVAITAPAGYAGLTVTGVSVGGVAQTLNCPAPAAGQYCAAIAGQVMTVAFGSNITITLTNIRVSFAANAPAGAGSADFTSTVDDTATPAVTPQGTAAGNADGDATDANSMTVQVVGNAVTSTVAEISPNAVLVGTGNGFIYDILPTINGGDTGVDQVVITAPAGYGSITVTTVSVGGTGLTPNCPTPGAGQYCSTVAGQGVTVTLGTKVTTSLTNIKVNLTANAPASTGNADFTSTLNDTATALIAPQAATVGNADGDATDANSMTVAVTGNAVTSAVAEINPSAVAVGKVGASFIYDFLPTLNTADTGVNQVTITAPAGYTSLTVTGISVGGTVITSNCPTPGPGQYCATVAGQGITVTLGTKVTTSLTNIRVNFTANAPGTVGSGSFGSTMDDTATPTAAQATTVGDASGNTADANSQTVTVQGNAVTSVLAEINPSVVVIGRTVNFAYDLLPTINPADTGIDQVVITTPSGYTAIAVNGVSISGSALASGCPTPTAGQYCATVAGQVITVILGSRMVTDQANIRITLTATAPASVGQGDFPATVDDASTTAVPAQAAVRGDANLTGNDSNGITVSVTAAADPARSSVTVDPPIVLANGVAVSTLTAIMRDSGGNPLSGKTVSFSSDRGAVDVVVQPTSASDAAGVVQGTIASTTQGIATITATDVTDTIVLNDTPQVIFTAGLVLRLHKTVNKNEVTIGDVVTYRIAIENTVNKQIDYVRIVDQAPPSFKYRKGSLKLRNVKVADPEGHQTQIFTIGSVGPMEKLTLQYQMIVGSGVRIGQDYNNRAIAKEDFTVPIASKAGSAVRASSVCDLCALSNTDEVTVRLVFDPIFDLGTIIGKVFYDTNRNGFQDRGENGVAGAMVALDDGTYAVTDADGRYHFPGAQPGQRLVKINLASISPEPVATTEEARVVQVTSGLLAKVNFGVIYDYDDVSISRKGIPGLGMDARSETEPIKVIGSTETMTLLINGAPVKLPGSEVRLGAEELSETVEMKGNKLTSPIAFDLQIDSREEVKSWALTVYDPRGEVFHRIRKTGPPPVVLKWNGKGFGKKLVRAGEVYQYVLEVVYTDGSRAESSRRLFGVNRTAAISLNLTGSAFEVGRATLSDEAKKILHEAAETLRQYPDEKVIIEGHADAVGTSELNMALSKERAQSALDYLIHEEKIPAARFVTRWYGETRPLASNELEEGREINRRVEISGQVKGKQEAKILDQLRTPPDVRLNDLPVEVQPDGRFQVEIPDTGSDNVRVQVKNQQGREVETTIPLPRLTILDPVEPRTFTLGEEGDGYRVELREADGEKPVIHYRLRGRTDPSNTLVMDGRPVPLQSDGIFEIPIELAVGRNVFGLVVSSPLTAARIVNLVIQVADRDEDGRLKMAVAPIPYLEVQFPVHGKPLREDRVPIIGLTSPENRITVNGAEVLVQSDGRFTTILTLPRGKSTPVRVEVTDTSGYTGALEREITVSGSDLFFLALADGEVGQLHGKGYLAGAGQSEEKDYYSQGRIAYYFKGTVLGKYLVTSAFDTGKREFNRMFTDLDRKETDRLFTNLDPDKYYPIYGDDSQVVYDAQSLGRFYLAVDSEEFHALVGDFPVGMNETELAAYNRTLYGGRVQYRSLSQTAYGAPMTEVTVFGAEVRTANAHNEFRGTGGSLYYASHDRITEGSEQVRIEVRDKNTGLVLRSINQERNLDYQIKYEEGRLLFSRPIPSVTDDSSSLVDAGLLGGNPVYILVDFEYQSGLFEDSAQGGRIRQQVGDHLALGGTYVKDEAAGADYELKAGDLEVRLGQGTRLLGEYAESQGTGGEVQFSDDGGLTFTKVDAGVNPDGRAYKTAIETDLGEPFGRPDLLRLSGYLIELKPGFSSSGTVLEQATRKAGIGLSARFSRYDTLNLRYEGQRLLNGGTVLSSGQVGGSELTLQTAQWTHEQGRFLLTAEVQERILKTGLEETKSQFMAEKLRYRVTDRLTTSMEQQNSVKGPQNNQTTAGLNYDLERIGVMGQYTTGTLGEAVRGGLSTRIGDNAVVTFSQQFNRNPEGQRGSQSMIHGENRLGSGTRVYSEYQLNHTAQSDTDTSIVGINHRWQVSQGWALNFLAEGSQIDQNGQKTTKDALGAGLNYERPERIRLSDRAEIRHERGEIDKVQYVGANGIEVWVGRDFRLLGKANASLTVNKTTENTEARSTELSSGLAYRPVAHDRLNALGKYTLITDQRPVLAGETERVTEMSVWSFEGALELTRYLQWVEKLAYKIKEERAGNEEPVKIHTTLSIHRLNTHVTGAWDIGLEYRLLKVYEADDQRAGYLVEVTREMARHLRLGVGYNFTDFTDNEFSDNNYSVRGWFFRFQGMY